MDELIAKLQSILSTNEGQQQLKNLQNALNSQPEQGASSNQGLDFSKLSSIFQSFTQSQAGPTEQQQTEQSQTQQSQAQQTATASGGNQGFDFSQLSSILSGLGQGQSSTGQPRAEQSATGQSQAGQSQGGFDISQLSSLLGGGNTGGEGGFDISMLLKLQQAFKSMNVDDKNSQLLYALKPHFSERRQAKVDQAVTIMRLITALPALKESGILSGILGL